MSESESEETVNRKMLCTVTARTFSVSPQQKQFAFPWSTQANTNQQANKPVRIPARIPADGICPVEAILILKQIPSPSEGYCP